MQLNANNGGNGPLNISSMRCAECNLVRGGGAGGRESGRTGGGRGTGDERRKGGRWDLYDGGKRERNSKSQAFFICYCLLPVKETNPTTFLDFHLTFSEA